MELSESGTHRDLEEEGKMRTLELFEQGAVGEEVD